MPVRAGQIVINLTLAQAQFMEKLVTAKAAVKDFSASGGRSFKEFGDTGGAAMKQLAGHSVSSVQATSGALRDLEGHFGTNMRAAERFLATTLGLGPVLQKAFPLIGGLAFGGMIVDLGSKVYTFFKDMQEAPEKMASAFRELNDPIRVSNDEMRVANDRLANEIAKLEGHHENTLKLALDEARLAADKLAESLDKDLQALVDLEKQQGIGKMMAFFTGKASTAGDQADTEQFVKDMAAIDRDGAAAVRNAAKAAELMKDEKAAKELVAAAQDAWDKKALGALDAQIAKYTKLLAEAQKIQDLHNQKGFAPSVEAYVQDQNDVDAGKYATRKYIGFKGGMGSYGAGMIDAPDQSTILKERQGQLDALQEYRDKYGLTTDQAALQGKKGGLNPSASGPDMDGLMRQRQEETNRLLQELAAATEKNLNIWDAINLKQQEMLQTASANANQASQRAGIVGPAVVPQEQVDLIQKIADAERLTASTKALEEFNRAMIDVEGEWEKLQGKRNEETVKLLFPKIDMKPYEEQERFDNVQSSADREALTRQAGFADRMSEIGGGSQEDKINLGYERRIELANQLKAVEQTRIDAELDLETKVHLMQEQQIASDKAIAEAEDERALKLAQVQQQRIKELTDPIINGLSEQLANAMTGKKTSFGKTAENAGHQMLEGSLNKLLHYGASKLKLGKPDGSKGNAYHVIVDGGAGDGAAAAAGDSDGSAATASTGNSGILEKLVSKLLGRRDPYAPTTGGWTGVVGPPVLSDGGADAGSDLPDLDTFDPPFLAHAAGAASALGGAFGHLPELTASGMSTLLGLFSAVGGGGGGVPSVSSSIDYGGPMAGGGPVLPGVSYGIHDGTDELFIPGSPGNIVPVSKMGGGNTININHSVDARGSDLGAANRINRGLEATHAAAVKTAMHAMVEHQKRTVRSR